MAEEIHALDLGSVLRSWAESWLERLRASLRFGQSVLSGQRPLGEMVSDLLDGYEQSAEEMVARWRRAGLRWPLVVLATLNFLTGLLIGWRLLAARPPVIVVTPPAERLGAHGPH